MSNWGDEPTRPVQGTGGGMPGGDPTMPATRVGGGSGGPGGPGDGGGGYDGDDEWEEERDRRKLWLIVGGVLLVGLLIGALIAILASGDGDDDNGATTTTSTTTTSTTTSTTTTTTAPTTTTTPPTTQAPAPQITQFVNQSGTPTCPGTSEITLKWATQNASNVTIFIDNPNGAYGNYPANGTQSVPFACGGDTTVSHTYYLTANGANNVKSPQQQITVTSNPGP